MGKKQTIGDAQWTALQQRAAREERKRGGMFSAKATHQRKNTSDQRRKADQS